MNNGQIEGAHTCGITALACHPGKLEVITGDKKGCIKIWSIVPKNSDEDNNEAVTHDPYYTWTSSYHHIFLDQPIQLLQYSCDGSILAISYGSTISLISTTTYEVLHTFTTPSPSMTVHLSVLLLIHRSVFCPSSLRILSSLLLQMKLSLSGTF